MDDKDPILTPPLDAARKPVSSDDPSPKPGPPTILKLNPPHESVFRYANNRKNRKINRNVWWRIILRLMFSHVGLFFMVMSYSLAGTYIFIALEKPTEEEAYMLKKVRFLEMNDSIEYISSLLWYQASNKTSKDIWNDMVWKQMKQLEEFIIDSVNDVSYDGKYEGWHYEWTFYNTLLLTVSIMSTIGYGHLCPQTAKGKAFCVIYGMLGIPLLLLFLAAIGDVMARSFRYSYSRWCCHWCRMKRRKSEYRRGDQYLLVPRDVQQSVLKEKIGEEYYMPTHRVVVPIALNLVILTGYILAGAFLFSKWEDWDLVEAGYFTFITLSTIGYGDYVPGNSFTSADGEAPKEHTSDMLRMFAASFYCAFGLALLSMCISLMQEQVRKKVKNVGRNIGLVKEEEELKQKSK